MMKTYGRALLIVAFTAVAALAQMPRLRSVEPNHGKQGEELVVSGENLSSKTVADLFLTDGKNDHKVNMSEQTEESIRFQIPDEIKPGRYALMVLTKGATPTYLEQPVFCTVDEP